MIAHSPSTPLACFRLALAAFAALLPACRTGAPAEPQPIAVTATAQDVLDALERRLLERPWRLDFEIRSEGFVSSHFDGRVDATPGARLELEARGEFMGRPKVLRLVGSRDFLQASASADGTLDKRESARARPAGLDEALVVGLTHMGLLHNLAVLSEGQPPDHCDGGVRQWLGLADLTLFMPEPVDGRTARKLGFRVLVDGRRSAESELWLAVDDGLPLRRATTVHFPDGDMRVVERYRWNAP